MSDGSEYVVSGDSGHSGRGALLDMIRLVGFDLKRISRWKKFRPLAVGT